MRPPSPDDPGRPGGTSHVRTKINIPKGSGDKFRLGTIVLRHAELTGLGLVRLCGRSKRNGGHRKATYPTRDAASRAAREMAPILGVVQDVYQCKQHFHLATPKRVDKPR